MLSLHIETSEGSDESRQDEDAEGESVLSLHSETSEGSDESKQDEDAESEPALSIGVKDSSQAWPSIRADASPAGKAIDHSEMMSGDLPPSAWPSIHQSKVGEDDDIKPKPSPPEPKPTEADDEGDSPLGTLRFNAD